MADRKFTIFQRLQRALSDGGSYSDMGQKGDATVNQPTQDDVIASASSKEEYDLKLLQAQQRKYLANQWIKTQYDIDSRQMANLNDLRVMYRDCDLMDAFPEIGAALDIVSEESCLTGDTKIKLLNGTTTTLEKAYKKGERIFWAYTTNVSGEPMPTLIEKVVYKGEQPTYDIKLDDGTIIHCTDNHKWLMPNGEWKRTDELEKNDSMMTINTRENDYGYEEISTTNCEEYQLTHDIVAKNLLKDSKKRLMDCGVSENYIAIHHTNFVKSNNDPSALVYVSVDEYRNYHGGLDDEQSGSKHVQKKLLNPLRKLFDKAAMTRKVKSVKKTNRLKKVYDAYNSSENHSYGVLCKNGMVITHNCDINKEGFMLNINSRSDRIKSILDDLFVNRLSINTLLPMICRSMCKYGNTFMLLNLGDKNGIIGWKELPVYEIERYEHGMTVPYQFAPSANNNPQNLEGTKFIWISSSQSLCYRNFQMAHFRLLYDSQLLPYGQSFLAKARRHFRMLSMMEDMMLIYRLDRSVERRVFKIPVGAIDDQDVESYIQQIANRFKRTPIIDPQTGQIDTRKNLMPVWRKTLIPLLDGRVISIEDLAKEYEEGKENFVYSIQDKTLNLVPGKVMWCGKNYHCDEMIKITLDDGSYAVMAPEHEFIMRDGTKKCADKLSIGESVMPFYTQKDIHTKRSMNQYEKTYNPNNGKYIFTHRFVANELEKNEESNNTVHHKDFNKYNNNPTNLLWCDYDEHKKMHAEIAVRRSLEMNLYENYLKPYNESELHEQHNLIRSEKKKAFWHSRTKAKKARAHMTIKFDKYIWGEMRNAVLSKKANNRKTLLYLLNTDLISHLLDINPNKRLHHMGRISRTVLEQRLKERGYKTVHQYVKEIAANHKIANIERIFDDDVYCMNVLGLHGEEDRHNFAIKTFQSDGVENGSGCFLSNCAMEDFFIPILPGQDYTPIETLASGQNLTAMDDIKFIQNKIVTAMRVPKAFLNFEEAQGEGKNLSLLDVRFTKTVNRIQEALLMELNKIAIIHLCLLGFTDELTNFKLSMNNPSSQAEMLELENLAKKITTAKDMVSDPGSGIPLTSMTWVWKNIFKWSDKEIQRNLDEMRLETALAVELQKTEQIIKKTGLFDAVDNIYGEPGAEYQESMPDGTPKEGGKPGGGGGGGMPFGGGGELDFGSYGEEVEGEEGEMEMAAAAREEGAPQGEGEEGIANLGDAIFRGIEKQINEKRDDAVEKFKTKAKHHSEKYYKRLTEKLLKMEEKKPVVENVPIYDKTFFINEELNDLSKQLTNRKNTLAGYDCGGGRLA